MSHYQRKLVLLADGATYWPYQVSEVLVSDTGLAALLPGHKIIGYGGDKWPIDLARRVKDMAAPDFER